MATDQSAERLYDNIITDTPARGFAAGFVHAATEHEDAIDLAERCQQLADELVEPAMLEHPQAVLEDLAEILEELDYALDEPLTPEHLRQITAGPRAKTTITPFVEESDLLVDYCSVLADILPGNMLNLQQQTLLTGLLYDLVHYLGNHLKAPRKIELVRECHYFNPTE